MINKKQNNEHQLAQGAGAPSSSAPHGRTVLEGLSRPGPGTGCSQALESSRLFPCPA